jgi:hypothetical protein
MSLYKTRDWTYGMINDNTYWNRKDSEIKSYKSSRRDLHSEFSNKVFTRIGPDELSYWRNEE